MLSFILRCSIKEKQLTDKEEIKLLSNAYIHCDKGKLLHAIELGKTLT